MAAKSILNYCRSVSICHAHTHSQRFVSERLKLFPIFTAIPSVHFDRSPEFTAPAFTGL